MTHTDVQTEADVILGCLLGTAAGDALGLPMEGLSRQRARKLFPGRTRYRLIGPYGLVSDDTEHAVLTLQALAASAGEVEAFRQDLARRLKLWFLAAPAAAGLATIKSCLRLLVGIPPEISGVRSAGNGPAMRAAILGAAVREDDSHLAELVRVSSTITHVDARACYGALAVAIAAAEAGGQRGKQVDGERYLKRLANVLPQDDQAQELLDLLRKAHSSVRAGEATETYATSMGWTTRVSGFIYATVPAAVHAWLAHSGDMAAAADAVIRCGGDTDSTGAVAGSLVGSGQGAAAIPGPLLAGLVLWPWSVGRMKKLSEQAASAVAQGQPCLPTSAPFIFSLGRNLAFLAVVLAHGLRRLLPPY